MGGVGAFDALVAEELKNMSHGLINQLALMQPFPYSQTSGQALPCWGFSFEVVSGFCNFVLRMTPMPSRKFPLDRNWQSLNLEGICNKVRKILCHVYQRVKKRWRCKIGRYIKTLKEAKKRHPHRLQCSGYIDLLKNNNRSEMMWNVSGTVENRRS